MRSLNALTVAHDCLRRHIKPGDFCIDATAGRGRDSLFLAELVGETGKILSFDIQKEALNSTEILLQEKGLLQRVKLILDSHSEMAKYAEPETVSAITFNLGWLPGGDHNIFTEASTSIPAIEAGLRLLKPDGIMIICVYYGKECGFEEKDTLLKFFPTLDYKKYSVLITEFVNRPNNPPIPVIIKKESLQ